MFRYYLMQGWVIPVLALLIFLASIVVNESALPDYLSYFRIFYNTGTVYEEVWRSDSGYYYLNRVFNNLGLSYDIFRTIIRFVTIVIFSLAIYSIQRRSSRIYKSLHPNLINDSSSIKLREFRLIRNGTFFSLLLLLFLVIFVFEFFFVRIRAGLAISLFLLALSFLWGRFYINLFNISAFTLVLLLAASIHFSTTMILLFMIIFPLIFSVSTKFSFGKKLRIAKSLKDLLTYLILGASGFFILYVSLELVPLRGTWLSVELNFFRLLSLFAFPYFVYFVYRAFSKTAFIDNKILSKNIEHAANSKDTFFKYCLTGYLSFILFLPFFYGMGYMQNSGEAVVRIYTLSSVISVFIIFALPSKEYRDFWFLIGLGNAFFFMNSILRSFFIL